MLPSFRMLTRPNFAGFGLSAQACQKCQKSRMTVPRTSSSCTAQSCILWRSPPHFATSNSTMNSSLLLLSTEEEHATLEAALAFLDGFESDADTDTSRTSGDSSGDSHKRPRSLPSDAKPTRKYHRTEILELRTQLELLTAQLMKLQERCSRERRALELHAEPDDRTAGWSFGSGNPPKSGLVPSTRLCTGSNKGTLSELGEAMLEYRRLQNARALNLRLKVDWRTQLELLKAMEATFEQQIATMARVRKRGTREQLAMGWMTPERVSL